jgi:hypothetical protein
MSEPSSSGAAAPEAPTKMPRPHRCNARVEDFVQARGAGCVSRRRAQLGFRLQPSRQRRRRRPCLLPSPPACLPPAAAHLLHALTPCPCPSCSLLSPGSSPGRSSQPGGSCGSASSLNQGECMRALKSPWPGPRRLPPAASAAHSGTRPPALHPLAAYLALRLSSHAIGSGISHALRCSTPPCNVAGRSPRRPI